MLDGKIIHGGNPVLRWMIDNVYIESDAAGNIKPSKKKSTEIIDGAVALIMALDRALRRKDKGSPDPGAWTYDPSDGFTRNGENIAVGKDDRWD